MFSPLLLLLFLCMSKMVTAYPTVSYAFPTRLCVFVSSTNFEQSFNKVWPSRGGAGNSYNTTPIPTIERVEKSNRLLFGVQDAKKLWTCRETKEKTRTIHNNNNHLGLLSHLLHTHHTQDKKRTPRSELFFLHHKSKEKKKGVTLLYLFAALGTGHGTRCTVWRTQEEERWLPPLPRCFFSRQISSSSLILKKKNEVFIQNNRIKYN